MAGSANQQFKVPGYAENLHFLRDVPKEVINGELRNIHLY